MSPLSALPSLPPPPLSTPPAPLCTPLRSSSAHAAWLSLPSHHTLSLFVARLAAASTDIMLDSPLLADPPEAVVKLLAVLDVLQDWVAQIPPLKTEQRYGNLAFRSYVARLSERGPGLFRPLVGEDKQWAVDALAANFAEAFGNGTRMDYGTGHEVSFLVVLLSLSLLGVFPPTPPSPDAPWPPPSNANTPIETYLALVVVPQYLRLCWLLQTTYHLEPAGSHGSWGLDDTHHLPYLLGSSQLLSSPLPPRIILSPPLPPTNLYFLAVERVREVKKGPFWETSPVLWEIAEAVGGWGKVGRGIAKMWEGEVLGKQVVCQHLVFGGVWGWDGPELERETGTGAQQVGVEEGGETHVPWSHSHNPQTTTTAFPLVPLTWPSSIVSNPTSAVPPTSSSSSVAPDAYLIPPTSDSDLLPAPKISVARPGSTRAPWAQHRPTTFPMTWASSLPPDPPPTPSSAPVDAPGPTDA